MGSNQDLEYPSVDVFLGYIADQKLRGSTMLVLLPPMSEQAVFVNKGKMQLSEKITINRVIYLNDGHRHKR
jgi:hypothetical protein